MKLVETFGSESRWVNWRLEPTADGKMTKRPYQAKDVLASSTDPETWKTYLEVEDMLNNGANRFNGVGIIFTPDKKLLGIDLDHCLKDGQVINAMSEKGTGNIVIAPKEQIINVIKTANTYTEISPSGEGLHLFFRLVDPLVLLRNKKEPFECYTSGRFFTVTNNPFGDSKPIRTVTTEEAIEILSLMGYPWGADKEAAISQPSTKELLDDETVVLKMFNAKNGDKTKALYFGDTSEHNGDDSSADMSLCCHLAFWTGRNTEQIRRIWLASPLGQREKTQKRKDYQDRTIANAIANTKEVYKETIEIGIPNFDNKMDQTVFQSMTFEQLMTTEFPPANWLMEPIFECNAINMISAPPNNWKSWLLLLFSEKISKGDLVLDRFETKKTNIMIVNEEDTPKSLQDRFKLLNINDLSIPIFFRISQGIKLEKTIVDNILAECKAKDIKLVIFDSLRSVHEAEENSSTEMQKIMDQLKRFIREGMSVIFTHHHKKNSFTGKDDAESSRGSTAINAAISGHISLKEDERPDGTFIIVKHLKSKAGEKMKPFEIKINKVRGSFNEVKSISFTYNGEEKSVDRKLMETKDKILYMLSSEPGKWKSAKEFFETAGQISVRKCLKMLVDEGTIKSIFRGEAKDKNIILDSQGASNEIMYCFEKEDDSLATLFEE